MKLKGSIKIWNTCSIQINHIKSFNLCHNVYLIYHTCARSFGMSLSSLSMVLGGRGVVSPASLLEISSAEVDESDDLLLRKLPPVELLSRIILSGGGWVRKYALETPNMGPYCCKLLAISTTLDEDNDIGVFGSTRLGGDFPLKEFGDKMDDTGDEAEECVDDVDGDGEGNLGILLLEVVNSICP